VLTGPHGGLLISIATRRSVYRIFLSRELT
jgi:hypothetical protein